MTGSSGEQAEAATAPTALPMASGRRGTPRSRTETSVAAGVHGPSGERVLIRRSDRRRRTVSLSRRDGDIVIAVPGRMSRAETDRWVERMLASLAQKERAASGRRLGDADLMHRAEQLSQRYLEGRARPRSVSWSERQQQRWGSCTAADGTIRLSTRLRPMPGWVIDSVLVHELAHLLVDDHGPEFRALVERYPRTIRAEGFLDGVSFARSRL